MRLERGEGEWVLTKYADFLDDAAKLIFLQKVGGGYQFYHSLLRDHFAKMWTGEEGREEQGPESDGKEEQKRASKARVFFVIHD